MTEAVPFLQSFKRVKRNNSNIQYNLNIFTDFQVIRARFGAPAHVTLMVFAFMCMALVTGLVMTEGTRVLTKLTDGKCFYTFKMLF